MSQTKSRSAARDVVLAAAALFFLSIAVNAQQARSADLPDAPAASQEPQSSGVSANPLKGGAALFQLLQEKSVVFPDLATNAGTMTPVQKFKLAANNSVSVSTIVPALIGAGFSQAIGTPSGYHQGAEGYAKRFGANMARTASYNFFGTFLLASALHEDPRFYVQDHLSFKQSVEYSALRVFVTRSDSGERVVNYSGIIGSLLSEGLANAYYPDQNRSAGSTLTRFGSDLGWRFGGNLLRQYWPKINRKLRLVPAENKSPNP